MDHPLIRRFLPIITVGAIALTVFSCGHRRSVMDSISADEEYLAAVAELERENGITKENDYKAPEKTHNPMPVTTSPNSVTSSEPVMTPFEYKSVNDATWAEVFNDSNKYQYPYAEKFGIEPIHAVGQAFYTRQPIVRITSTTNYTIDSLTHSLPFLVPRAEHLLNDIGSDFIQRLKKKGVHGWRILVTSLLRTPASVKSLRRVNINATDSSAHQFATTFDISYLRFRDAVGATPVSENLLKQTLAETLFDFRKKERCMVKYELKTHCFHITVTK